MLYCASRIPIFHVEEVRILVLTDIFVLYVIRNLLLPARGALVDDLSLKFLVQLLYLLHMLCLFLFDRHSSILLHMFIKLFLIHELFVAGLIVLVCPCLLKFYFLLDRVVNPFNI